MVNEVRLAPERHIVGPRPDRIGAKGEDRRGECGGAGSHGRGSQTHVRGRSRREYDDGEREASDGRSTDILTRTGNGWRFVSWVHSEWGEDE